MEDLTDRPLSCLIFFIAGWLVFIFSLAKVYLRRQEAAEAGEGGLMTVPAAADGGEEGGTGDAPADASDVAVVCVSSEAFLEKRGRGGE